MFIETVETPNPNALKFVAKQTIYSEGFVSYSLEEYNENKNKIDFPLIKDLFNVEGIIGIFISNDFITITKKDDEEWAILKPIILAELMEFLLSDKKYDINHQVEKKAKNQDIEFTEDEKNPEKNKIIKEMLEIIEERIKPAVAMHGGDVIFRGYKDNIVYLTLSGSCDGCPSASATLKNGIENIFKYYIKEVKDVVEY